jgi:hypothetical protein
MLHNKIDSERYKSNLIKKLANFCDKAPVLVDFITTEHGVTIVHTNSGTEYEFPWKFTTNVKTFIYEIKQVLVTNHYPRMIQTLREDVALSPQEVASYMTANQCLASEVPVSKSVETKRLWRIDRVIVWQDTFILIDEATNEQFRYKMMKSCVYFLKNYRNKKYDLDTAAEYFFENSKLINKIESK